jgi:hypothetical protein
LRLLWGDGNGKINFNTASRDDCELCPDMGGGYGNPRLLRTPKRNISELLSVLIQLYARCSYRKIRPLARLTEA